MIKFLLFFFTINFLFAINGSISGKVTDGKSPLSGANVYIENTVLGAMTDSVGNYSINNLDVGKYRLIVNYIGFEKFGEEYNDENIDILIVPHGEYEVNIQQYIYETIVLAIPSKLVHPGVEDGTLDSEILKKLEELSPKLKDKKEKEDEIDPRWNTLKKLLTDK